MSTAEVLFIVLFYLSAGIYDAWVFEEEIWRWED